MTITQSLIVGAAALFGLVDASLAQEAKDAQNHTVQDQWIARVKTNLGKLDGDEQASAVIFAVIGISESGENDQAKAIIHQFLPPNKRPGVLIMVADAQSTQGLLKEALATVREIPTEQYRQPAIALVIARQAQRGDIEDAITLLPKITKQSFRDRAFSAIAEAQAVAGDLETARTTAKHISDEDMRRRTRETVDNAKSDPIRKIRSGLLRQQINVMFAFSGTEGQSEAINAIAAAQRKDHPALNKHMEAALVNSQKSIPLEIATTQTLLAVALVEADRLKEAKQMIQKARKSNDEEWLGVSGIFGSPVLVHLLIQLDMNDELQDIMNSLEKDHELGGQIAYHSNIEAIGATYAYLNRPEEAEKYYDHFKSPLEHLHFAVGVLTGLQDGG